MLISIDIDIPALEAADKAVLTGRINELFRAHRLGDHLLVLPRTTAEWIRENLVLSPDAMSTCIKLGQEFTQTSSLVKRASTYVRLTLASHPTTVAGSSVIQMGLGDLNLPFRLARAAVVVEDAINDGGIIREIMLFWARRQKFPNTSFETVHAGGERFVDILRLKIEESRAVVAFVDSDRHSPSASLSAKGRRAEELLAEYSGRPLQLVCFPGKEIENIIPSNVIATLPAAAQKSSTLAKHTKISSAEEKLKSDASERYWLYFDIKQGISNEALKKITNKVCKDWIEQKIAVAIPNLDNFSFDGFGDNVVSQLLRDKNLLQSFLRSTLSAQWYTVFGSILEEAMWLCVAAPRSYV